MESHTCDNQKKTEKAPTDIEVGRDHHIGTRVDGT
jgi:hypothetical protein